MATWLDHATWFFDSAWGDVIVGMGVPVASAAVAAYLVIQQIKRADATRDEDLRIARGIRTDDRRAEAVSVLAEYVSDAATIAVDRVRMNELALHTFRANAQLARAYGLLGLSDRVIGRWVASEVAYFNNLTYEWAEKAVVEGEVSFEGAIGPERATIQRLGAEALQALLSWQGGDLPLSWFEEHMRADEGGPVRQSNIIIDEPAPPN